MLTMLILTSKSPKGLIYRSPKTCEYPVDDQLEIGDLKTCTRSPTEKTASSGFFFKVFWFLYVHLHFSGRGDTLELLLTVVKLPCVWTAERFWRKTGVIVHHHKPECSHIPLCITSPSHSGGTSPSFHKLYFCNLPKNTAKLKAVNRLSYEGRELSHFLCVMFT